MSTSVATSASPRHRVTASPLTAHRSPLTAHRPEHPWASSSGVGSTRIPPSPTTSGSELVRGDDRNTCRHPLQRRQPKPFIQGRDDDRRSCRHQPGYHGATNPSDHPHSSQVLDKAVLRGCSGPESSSLRFGRAPCALGQASANHSRCFRRDAPPAVKSYGPVTRKLSVSRLHHGPGCRAGRHRPRH